MSKLSDIEARDRIDGRIMWVAHSDRRLLLALVKDMAVAIGTMNSVLTEMADSDATLEPDATERLNDARELARALLARLEED